MAIDWAPVKAVRVFDESDHPSGTQIASLYPFGRAIAALVMEPGGERYVYVVDEDGASERVSAV